MIGRRDFLKSFPLALAPNLSRLAANVFGAAENQAGGEKPVVKKYNSLGKTDLQVGDIGFGVAVSTDPQLLVEAFARGVNYFDVIPFYTWSVEMLAAAFAKDARMRREAIIASKVECEGFFAHFAANPILKVEPCVDSLLRKLGRDHIDILQLHSVTEGGPEDLNWVDAATEPGAAVQRSFERLKKSGKIRYAGATSHGPKLLREVMEKTLANEAFDMIMPALNFRQTHELRAHLTTAAQKKVGVIAMKVLANARQANLAVPAGRPFSQAAIAWALSQPAVNGVVITIKDHQQLDEYLGASGGDLKLADTLRLWLFAAATAPDYCVTGCGRCAVACPHDVDVPTLLRIDQYWTNYQLPEYAREHFAGFQGTATFSMCRACADPRCERACPNGVKIRQRAALALARFAGGKASS